MTWHKLKQHLGTAVAVPILLLLAYPLAWWGDLHDHDPDD